MTGLIKCDHEKSLTFSTYLKRYIENERSQMISTPFWPEWKLVVQNDLPGLEAVNMPDDKLNIFPLFVMIVSQTTTDSNVVYALFDNAIWNAAFSIFFSSRFLFTGNVRLPTSGHELGHTPGGPGGPCGPPGPVGPIGPLRHFDFFDFELTLEE